LLAVAGPRLVTVSVTWNAVPTRTERGAARLDARSALALVASVTVSVKVTGVAAPDVAVTVNGPVVEPARKVLDVAVPSLPETALLVVPPLVKVAPDAIVKVTDAPETGLL
jgi:hypothetical protein